MLELALRRRAVRVRGPLLPEQGPHHPEALLQPAAGVLDRRARAAAGSSEPAGAPTAGSSTRSATSTSLARLAEDYRASALAHGKEPRIALFREAWIGETREECERVWGPHALAVHRLYYNVGVYHERFEPWVHEVRDRADFTLDRLGPGRFLYGSPDEVRATVEEWREITGADYLALRFRHPGGPSHEETLEALRLFGSEVIAPLGAAAV